MHKMNEGIPGVPGNSSNSPNLRPTIFSHQQNQKQNKKLSIALLGLIGTSIFLFVLCLCLLCALVLVGQNLSRDRTNVKNLMSNELLESLILDDTGLSGLDKFNLTTLKLPNQSVLLGTEYNLVSNNNNNVQLKNNTAVLSESEISNLNNLEIMNLSKNVTTKILNLLTFRLPENIRPISYELLMQPNLTNKTFSGQVKINLNITGEAPFIVLHSNKLEIKDTLLKELHLTNPYIRDIPLIQSFLYPPLEFLVIEPEHSLHSGNYLLDITFSGSLTNRIIGFYGSSYFDKIKNETRYLLGQKTANYSNIDI